MADAWSRTLTSGRGALIASDQVLQGNSHGNPCLGEKPCSAGKKEWRVRCDGSHRIVLGVARPTAALHKLMWSSEDCWGVALDDRDMDFAKKFAERKRGPVSFKVPCEVTMTLDCDNGTLSMTVAGIDLGVLCTSLPRREPLHLAISTRSSSCSLTLLKPQPKRRQSIAKQSIAAGIKRKRPATRHVARKRQSTSVQRPV